MINVRLPKPVRRLLAELVIADRERRGSDFAAVRRWPERVNGFEDLAFLFSSTILAHGVASLRLDEAAYLYRLVRGGRPQAIAEIGRFRGGSTFLLAAAAGADATVHSYDIGTRQGRNGAELDRLLSEALERYGLADRVVLHVEDSKQARPPSELDLLFIDGDHSEAGVRADFERWSPHVRRGGHLLFHDALDAPDLVSTFDAGPALVAAEAGSDWERREAAGSLAHLVRRS
jgi:predicted O-methyltransferase YrrM